MNESPLSTPIPMPIPMSMQSAGAELADAGAVVVGNCFNNADIETARRTVLDNVGLMRRTRRNPSSRHLAGFHRYPELEPLHQMITGNDLVRETMSTLLGPDFRTIGLSDITVNRSQQWHKDLLRGRFSHHLDPEGNCANHNGKVLKVLMYLQRSSSLQFVPRSHLRDVPLDSDDSAIPDPGDSVLRLPVGLGDAVVIDVCTTHRGSSDEELDMMDPGDEPRILISTVFARANCEFADRMEVGNAARLLDWQRREWVVPNEKSDDRLRAAP